MMLVLYGFGIRYDVKSVPMTVLDQDGSPQESRQYIERFAHSPYFAVQRYVDNYRDLQIDIDRGESRIGLVVISADFGRRLGSRREAVVQVIVDGADNNTATIAMNYVSQITRSTPRSSCCSRWKPCCGRRTLRFPPSKPSRASGSIRIWKACSSSCPAIIAIIMMIVGTVLTAVTIVKEKEQGTIEQIVSSPIGRYELMVGKVMPYAVLAYVDFLLIVGASYFLFGVTIKGSLVLLLVTAFYLPDRSAGTGDPGLDLDQTQMAAMLTAILASMLPSILFPGFIFPIRQMPRVPAGR